MIHFSTMYHLMSQIVFDAIYRLHGIQVIEYLLPDATVC